jgi:hypothetical protein
MPKVEMLITERLNHRVEVEVDEATLAEFQEELGEEYSSIINDMAGDYTSRDTIIDGEFELDDFRVLNA